MNRIVEIRSYATAAWIAVSIICGTASMADSPAWSPLGDLEGGAPSSLAIDPSSSNRLYAGFYRKIYRTTDGGATWIPSSAGLDQVNIMALEVSPHDQSVLAAGSNRQIYRSTDLGDTWSLSSDGIALGGEFSRSSIVFDPISPTMVFWGSRTGGVFKSTDGGASWNPANDGLSGTSVSRLLVDPTISGTLYALLDGEIYKTTDSAGLWQPSSVGIGDSVVDLALDPSNPQTLFAAVGYSALYRSTNGGDSWSELVSVHPGSELRVHPSNSDLFAIRDEANARSNLFRSTDNGTSWTNLTPDFWDSEGLLFDPASASTFYATLSGTLHKTTDSGATWFPASSGIHQVRVWDLAIAPSDPEVLYLGTANQGKLRSRDGGQSFETVNSGMSDLGNFANAIAVHPLDADIVVAEGGTAGDFWNSSSYPAASTAIVRSTDGGDTWTPVANTHPMWGEATQIWAVLFDPSDPTIVYAGSTGTVVDTFKENGFYKSTDTGMTFELKDTGWPATTGRTASSIVASPGTPSVVYAASIFSSRAGIFRSADGGETWSNVMTGSPFDGTLVGDLAVDPGDPDVVYAATAAGLFQSTNGGASWIQTDPSFPSGPATAVALNPQVPRLVYAASGTGGTEIFFSDDSGGHWKSFSQGFDLSRVLVLRFDPGDPDHLMAGTYTGLWHIVHRPHIFTDGFESGDTSAWSGTVP